MKIYINLSGTKIVQEFEPSQGHNVLSRIKLLLERYGNAIDYEITLRILYSLYSRDSPNSERSSITTCAENIPTNYDWVEFNFPDCCVSTALFTYYIISEVPELDNSGINVYGISNYDAYSKGMAFYYDLADNTWISHQYERSYFDIYDFSFKTYGYYNNAPAAQFSWIDSDGHDPDTEIIFDASASSNSDGYIAKYVWYFGSYYQDGKIKYEEKRETTSKYTTYDFQDCNYHRVDPEAFDELGKNSDREPNNVRATISQPPNEPIIEGPTTALVDQECSFTFLSNDLEGDHIYYDIGHNEKVTDFTIGPFNSGEESSFKFTFTYDGDHSTNVRARDETNSWSDWSGHQISIIKSKTKAQPEFLKLY